MIYLVLRDHAKAHHAPRAWRWDAGTGMIWVPASLTPELRRIIWPIEIGK